ncbi:MAG: radical SAM protein [Acidobacteriia bacterium]|nr:radical SAM protein [Terriglobia bacterium]
MTGKFIRRTLRNVIFPKQPYFAHLAITHRCNLKCRFCHVTETRFAELDTASTKRVIDVLDRMGVAVISISGGGEPLLRPDFDEIINYAASKGLYVKLTSNGTMPRAKYERLLKSGVEEIGISLDGVRGSDLPFSHVGAPILSALGYLNDNLPPGKKLTINVTVSESNRDQVQEILDYCAAHYPRVRVWLNPVVVGEGALRTSRVIKTKPGYLRDCHSATLLSAAFYADAADRQYRREKFDWGCLAGEQFFDVKPNGDFWLCQDKPSPVKLNVLEPDFGEKRKYLNKNARRDCSGCVYSCYYVVQNSFYPRNWRDVALLWWQMRTEPGSVERRAADRFGWLGGLFSLLFPRAARRAVASLAMLPLFILSFVAGLHAATPPPELAPSVVLDRMEQAGRWQQANLENWTSIRIYSASNGRLHKWAKVKIRLDYAAPGQKTFCILESTGSRFIAKRVIYPILEAECQSAMPQNRVLTDINRKNYAFQLIEFDATENAYVFGAVPHFPERYQFRGRIWVDAETFGIKRSRGVPAVSPSLWVKRTEFTHEYGRFSGFWLPVHHCSQAELRLFGRSTLEIDYGEYRWSGDAWPATEPPRGLCPIDAESERQWSIRLVPFRPPR